MSVSWEELLSTYRYAYLSALLIALGCSVVGVYVILRRISFVGIATAQISAAGVALAFLFHLPPVPAAIVAALIGVTLFARGKEPVQVSRDGLVGLTFAVASALSILFVARSGAELDQVEHIIYGSLLFTTRDQAVLLGCGMAAVLLVHVLFSREFLMVSCDAETSRTLGVRTRLFNLLLFLSLGVVIALSIGAAGSLLAFSFLILPPMTGMMVSRTLGGVFGVSILSGLITALSGVCGSILFDLPTGPTIVVAGAMLFLAAWAYRIRPLLGAVMLVALTLLTIWGYQEKVRQTRDLIDGERPAGLHVDLELVAHDRVVSRGEPLELDYVVRIQGAAPADLHLLVDGHGLVAVHRLVVATTRGAGRLELATDALEPGSYELSGSLWTGDPLDPVAETELLPPEVCPLAHVTFEVEP